jgi:hypothetical protein
MTEKRDHIRIDSSGPAYLAWRGELLAELALAQVEELVVLKRPKESQADFLFDFVVTAHADLCFFVEVKAFSSMRLKRDPRNIPDWQLKTDAEVIRKARKSANPVVAFLFDADSDYGRFLRLDTVPEPDAGVEAVVLTFPIENALTAESLRNLVTELDRSRLVQTG